MFPYKTSFSLQRDQGPSLYLQLSNQFITLIKNRTLPPKTKLPSSRNLAMLLGVHRKTVVACYDELLLQGWVESIPKKGTYVHADLPILHQQEYLLDDKEFCSSSANFTFKKEALLERKTFNTEKDWTVVDDGISDVRLTPLEEIARTYRRLAGKKSTLEALTYGPTHGNSKLRKALAEYLNTTRGLHISEEQILITRGSQMGIFLASRLLLTEHSNVIVGNTNYIAADVTIKEQKANLVRVTVDENGLNTQEIEEVCKRKKITAVFVTSHHHHPTTVTLSAERRIHLLNLAKEYQFAIIEDDYDYDFNYNHAPILPLASHDTHGNVIYIGSICKTVAPVFRIGYLVAPKDFVDQAAKTRRYIDRQGDALLELTFADFIKTGDLDRHIKKILKAYKIRRDLFCKLLKEELGDAFSFQLPKGGMAVWVALNKKYSWDIVCENARKFKLEIGDWRRYDMENSGHNAIRIGFASMNEDEIRRFVDRLKKAFIRMQSQEKS
ncbi:PLP-dependent aminotransferase family protein [Flavobacteriaceae bacterium S356]|uniref:PLP-dependent aminotransferase family protein n=1 Tax=Asprobacillus argus TaxID=3076534 RepID=A0ABU3LHN7_9FLAO|nr:PLP-dependent aminotransferase family protein [Flavobacteriaceae bacterium S356]